MQECYMTRVEMPRKRFEIDHSQAIVTMGSCFSEHIGRRLADGGFRCDTNPFGVLYNPLSISAAIRRILSGKVYDEGSPELIAHEGRWHSLMHHSTFSASTKAGCLSLVNERLLSASASLHGASVLLVTFGSAYVYRYKPTGEVVGNCHKLPERMFVRERLLPETIVEDYTRLLAELEACRPDLHIIFTVSPIRHLRDGLHGNQLGKAALLLAIDRLVEAHPDKCHYFPAYEIMMDELRDYRFYADDMLHPTPLAIGHIWGYFAEHFFSLSAKKLLQAWEKIRRGLEHRPFDPDSEQYKQFLSQLALRIEQLKEKNPNFDVEKELTLCRTRLNR